MMVLLIIIRCACFSIEWELVSVEGPLWKCNYKLPVCDLTVWDLPWRVPSEDYGKKSFETVLMSVFTHLFPTYSWDWKISLCVADLRSQSHHTLNIISNISVSWVWYHSPRPRPLHRLNLILSYQGSCYHHVAIQPGWNTLAHSVLRHWFFHIN